MSFIYSSSLVNTKSIKLGLSVPLPRVGDVICWYNSLVLSLYIPYFLLSHLYCNCSILCLEDSSPQTILPLKTASLSTL